MACRNRRKNQRTPQPPQPSNKPKQLNKGNSTMNTQTQTGQISGQLSTLADIFATVALYASTDPNKQPLQLVTCNNAMLEACDSYAAIRYELDTEGYCATPDKFTLPAADIAKALTNANKISTKTAQATITATPDTWTIETPCGTITGNNPQHETPNTAQIWHDTQTATPEPFAPVSLSQWQLERIAKTTKQGKAKRDSIATLTHYTNPSKPIIYTIDTNAGQIHVLTMTCKPRTN
jgi:autotransporter translocation and assembly factor TamB